MLKITVVDDSLIIRKNIVRMLERMGHEVVAEAKNGKEAIACFTKHNPDLITMDITMPDMDGIESVKGIKKRNKMAKVIMITSHGQEEKVIEAIKAGASGYILKPITADKLDKAIKKIFPNGKPLAIEVSKEEEKEDVVVYENEDDLMKELESLKL